MNGGDIMDEIKYLTTIDEVKTFSDPFRYRILTTFYKMKQPATVKEVAVAMDLVPANVHYHVKKMEKAGILKLIYTKEINGIIAKYYEPTAKSMKIKCSSKEQTEGSNKLLLAESQKMLSQIYDDSKSIFMEQLSYGFDPNVKYSGAISMDEIYLTDSEAEEFIKHIQAFTEKYSDNKRSTDGIKKYNVFTSLYEIRNEKKE